MSAFHKHDAVAFNDDGADADKWEFGKFAIHKQLSVLRNEVAIIASQV